ncbi:MAG: aldehyde ferredoxin oxidoreductase C-terminal domain-containing protein [Planctomycetota bacterium]
MLGFGGSALAVALVGAELDLDPAARPLVVAVGDAVRRGVPTAARAAIAGVSPLTGRYAEGHVGGDLGARLAAAADALVVTGRGEASGAATRVLVVDELGDVQAVDFAELEALRRARVAACRERFGPCAALVAGPPARAASPSRTSRPTSRRASSVAAGSARCSDSTDSLRSSSPRVPRRPTSTTATPWCCDARCSRLPGSWNARTAADSNRSRRTRSAAITSVQRRSSRRRRGGSVALREHRARGLSRLSTPCGFVFEDVIGGVPGVRGRFGATRSFGAAIGLGSREDAVALLAVCDEHGVDAKEVGAVLAAVCEACECGTLDEPSPKGDRAALAAWIARIVWGDDDVAPRARRPVGSLPCPSDGGPRGARTLPARAARHDLAAVAATAGAGAGTDPMRSFPFATDVGRERLRDLVPGAPPGSDRPESPEGKGLVAWWHENVVAALDSTGFCVFSGMALLADGVLGLDELARAVAPPAMLDLAADPAHALLASGASVAVLRAELDARLGGPAPAPAWAQELVERSGVRDLYRACRGLDERGVPKATTLALVATERLARPVAMLATSASGPRAAPDRTGPAPSDGDVRVVGWGLLGAALGGEVRLDASRAVAWSVLLERLVAARPDAERRLRAASAWSSGRRLDPEDVVTPGARVDLVLALAGG